MDKGELKELLEKPLDPNLDYFDATPAIERIAEHLRGQHKLINFLANHAAQQAQSILELRKEIVEIKADLLADRVTRQEKTSSIIMPSKKIERPN
jgi:hypothetical protein